MGSGGGAGQGALKGAASGVIAGIPGGPIGMLGGALGGAAGGAALGGISGGLMGSGSGGVPATPTPQNSYSYVNGVPQASSVYNQKLGGYVNNYTMTGEQRNLYNQGVIGQQNSLNGMNNALGSLTPNVIQQYSDAYAKPQIDTLNRSYNDAYGTAANNAGSSGTLGSVGFDRYLGNQLEYNRAQGLADIQAQAKIAGYELPSIVQQPFLAANNAFQSEAGGQSGQMPQQQLLSQQGSQQGNQFALNNFQNLMNRFYMTTPRSLTGAMTGTY